ncbi:arginine methyltransferase 3 [Arctopsyche grandis]|uniref:arginine methyltransferase 3 n=1 Tax=Arctopsyche grandis TaxID=121162 RepID=UPI00406DA279
MSEPPELSSDSDEFAEDEWTEVVEGDGGSRGGEGADSSAESRPQCLFCSNTFPHLEEALIHCKQDHNFDLSLLKVKHNMDFYSFIKLIGYIRTNKPDSVAIMTAIKPLWESDIYLKPVKHEEWLMYDFDSLDDAVCSPQSSFHANVENGLVTLSEAHFVELQRTIQSLTAEVKEKKSLLALATEDITTMKRSMHNIMSDGKLPEMPVTSPEDRCVEKMDVNEDLGYFSTYAHFSIHHDMLSDKVRTESYQRAILDNRSIIENRVVLDLGCGTGILSMFSASTGASKVYAIDQSDIIYHAMDIIRENDLQNKINIIKGRLEDTPLPEKVDVIVSEWMGYFLLFEGMLDSVIFARNHWLKPGGILMPNKCNISIVGSGDMETHQKLISFWSNVYGYKMNCMKSEVIREASIDVANPSHLITSPSLLCEIDMNTCTTNSVNFSSEFQLNVLRDGSLTFLVGYFDTFFDLPNPVSFSTGPESTPTHWKQTIFYLKDPIPLKKGETLNGKLTCHRNISDVRGLTIVIKILDKTYKYILS